jgi:hypothetical protein
VLLVALVLLALGGCGSSESVSAGDRSAVAIVGEGSYHLDESDGVDVPVSGVADLATGSFRLDFSSDPLGVGELVHMSIGGEAWMGFALPGRDPDVWCQGDRPVLPRVLVDDPLESMTALAPWLDRIGSDGALRHYRLHISHEIPRELRQEWDLWEIGGVVDLWVDQQGDLRRVVDTGPPDDQVPGDALDVEIHPSNDPVVLEAPDLSDFHPTEDLPFPANRCWRRDGSGEPAAVDADDTRAEPQRG